MGQDPWDHLRQATLALCFAQRKFNNKASHVALCFV